MLLGAPVRHLFMRGVAWYKEPKPTSVLEIGSYQGASALTWREAGCDITCVDLWEEYDTGPNGIRFAYAEFLQNTKERGIKHIKGKSEKVLIGFHKKETFDIIYIDGDHRYAGCKADILNSMPLIKDEGIICGDDLNAQYPDICRAEARTLSEEDFIRDADGIKYHPGVTCAVWDVFGEVSMWGGFWAMQKHGTKWKKISLKGMPVEFPSHFTPEQIEEAKDHLKDIEIL